VAAVTRVAVGSVGVSELSTQAAAWPRSNNARTACRRQRPKPLHTRWGRHGPVCQDQGRARREMRCQRLLGARGRIGGITGRSVRDAAAARTVSVTSRKKAALSRAACSGLSGGQSRVLE